MCFLIFGFQIISRRRQAAAAFVLCKVGKNQCELKCTTFNLNIKLGVAVSCRYLFCYGVKFPEDLLCRWQEKSSPLVTRASDWNQSRISKWKVSSGERILGAIRQRFLSRIEEPIRGRWARLNCVAAAEISSVKWWIVRPNLN